MRDERPTLDGIDLDTVDPDTFGAALRGIGLNLLVRDVPAQVAMLGDVFDMRAFQPTADFAILTYGDEVLQLHADGTYHSHPLGAVVAAVDARGPGIEIRLYDIIYELLDDVKAAMTGMLPPETRDKISGSRVTIETVWGLGYKMVLESPTQ